MGIHYLTNNNILRATTNPSKLQDEALYVTKIVAYWLTISKFPHLQCLVPKWKKIT